MTAGFILKCQWCLRKSRNTESFDKKPVIYIWKELPKNAADRANRGNINKTDRKIQKNLYKMTAAYANCTGYQMFFCETLEEKEIDKVCHCVII